MIEACGTKTSVKLGQLKKALAFIVVALDISIFVKFENLLNMVPVDKTPKLTSFKLLQLKNILY
jgi:hypothetical protein